MNPCQSWTKMEVSRLPNLVESTASHVTYYNLPYRVPHRAPQFPTALSLSGFARRRSLSISCAAILELNVCMPH